MFKAPLLLLLPMALNASAQDYQGVNTWGGTDTDQLNAVALDEAGNIFAFGGFWGTADMDPGPASTSFTSLALQDMFLSRFTPEGTFEWSIQLRGTDQDHSSAVVAKDNSIWIGGGFEDSLDVQPTAADEWLVSFDPHEDAMVARYDSDGGLIWAVSAGGSGEDYVNDIAVDADGNVIAIGYFQGTVDFDPGPNQTNTSAGTDAMFLWKLDPNGALVWVQVWNGPSSELGTAVAIGSANDIWIGGTYFGTLDLDPGAGTTNVTPPGFNDNAFLIHVDADANFLSGGHMGGYGNDILRDLCILASGDVVAVGQFSEEGDYDPGPNESIITIAGNYDCFAVKLSSDGAFAWAYSFGGPSYDNAQAIVHGPQDDLFISGGFDAIADLDPGPDVFELAGNGVADVFALTLGTDASFVNAIAWGGTGLETGMTVGWSTLGRQFVGGLFEGTTDFDPGPGIEPISSLVTSRDAFLTRFCTPYSIEVDTLICFGDSLFAGGEWQYGSGTFSDPFIAANGCDSVVVTFLAVEVCSGIHGADGSDRIRLSPVPSADILHLTLPPSLSGPVHISVHDALGHACVDQVVNGPYVDLDINALAPGSYSLRIQGERSTQVLRFAKE